MRTDHEAAVHPFWALLQRFKTDWRLLVPVLVAELAGMAFGWYYYWDVGQFDPASRYYEAVGWWPLVADSPNAVLLFFAALVAYTVWGWRHRVLDSLAFVLNLYVGFWTTFLFLAFPERMGTWDWGSTNNILFFAHLGMPLQALVLVPDLRADRLGWGALTGLGVFFAAFIAVDYWGPHLHPAPFLGAAEDATLHAGSPWLMVIAVAAWLAVVLPAMLRPTDRARSGTTPP